MKGSFEEKNPHNEQQFLTQALKECCQLGYTIYL